MSLIVGAVAAIPLFLYARRGELEGNPERFVGAIVAVLLVESLLYPAQADVPVGAFRVPFLSGNLRTVDALVVIGVLARATVRPLPQRISRSGTLWLLASVWLATATVRGLLVGHATNIVLFSAMSLVGLFGSLLLVAGCDPTRLIAMLRGRYVAAVAAVVLVLIANTAADGGTYLGTGLGVVHVDTASVFVALGTFVLLVEWSARQRSRWAAWAAVPLLASPLVIEQRATLVQLAATVLVVLWAMTRPEWRSNVRVPRIQLLWGLLAAVAVLMVVLIVQLSRDDGSLPFADYYEETFASEGQQLSIQARTEALEVGLDEWGSARLYGHGLGHTYEIIRPGGVGYREPGTFDNVPLDLLVRSGLVGLALFGAAFVSTLSDGISVWRRDRRSTVSALALAAVAVMVGVGVKALFESILEKGKLALVIGLSAGVIAAASRTAARLPRRGVPGDLPENAGQEQWI